MSLFLLDGPSATGKTTLVQALLQQFPGRLEFCRRLTTRHPRPGELDNPFRDYDFVEAEEFRRRFQAGELALSRDFEFGMSYGLPRQSVDQALQRGSALALVDLGTAPQARQLWPDCVCILLIAPLDELERRLHARGGHTPDQIAERLGNAAGVLSRAADYDYVVVNRPPDSRRALDQLCWIVHRHLDGIRQPLPRADRPAGGERE